MFIVFLYICQPKCHQCLHINNDLTIIAYHRQPNLIGHRVTFFLRMGEPFDSIMSGINLQQSQMSETEVKTIQAGFVACVSNFNGAYCTRKVTEFSFSLLMLILAVIALINIIHRQKMRENIWLFFLILMICCCLIVNICFCVFNTDYWLYAFETYFYNLYYLFLVGYVTKSYLFKYRQIVNFKKFLLDPQNLKIKEKERRIFYTVLSVISGLYTAIMITSIILQVNEQRNASEDEKCEEIWYLCFEALCILLSFIVLYTLYKNQREESVKVQEYEIQFQKRQRGSLVTGEKDLTQHANISNSNNKISSPLGNLWAWILFNVASQVFNLIESLLFVYSSPPQCLIVQSNYQASNILELIFVFLTMYLCFGSTLLYISKVAIKPQEHSLKKMDFSINQEANPNIQLNPATLIKNPSLSLDL